MTMQIKTVLLVLVLQLQFGLPSLIAQETDSLTASETSESSLRFTPEAKGRRQVSMQSWKEGYQWRLRIPERVFCDEGVLVGHDIHRVHKPVRWSKSAGSLRFDRDNLQDTSRTSLPLRIEYTVRIEPTSEGAAIVLMVKNTGLKPLHNVTGHICLGHLSESFRDPDFERTFIPCNQEYLSLRKTQRGTDPIRAHYLVKGQSPIKLFNNPTNRFWGPLSPEIADHGLILTRTRESTHLVALWFDPASELFQNSDESNMCIHSDPAFGDIEPGASVEVQGRIILFRGSLNQFDKTYPKKVATD